MRAMLLAGHRRRISANAAAIPIPTNMLRFIPDLLSRTPQIEASLEEARILPAVSAAIAALSSTIDRCNVFILKLLGGAFSRGPMAR